MNQKIKISIESIKKSFENNLVLNEISLNIKENSSLVIIGPSGSGKTVLAKTIIGLLNPDSGSILIDSTDNTKLSTEKKFKMMQKCGFLFQNGGLFDFLTVQENITFFAEKIYNLSRKDKEEIAINKLSSVKLSDEIRNLYPSELSGGMRKRVGIARAICTNPEILFLDDPTGGLDPILTSSISELVINIRKEHNPTIITITHNMDVTYKIADEIILINQGQIMWKGQKEEMKSSSNLYLQQFVNGIKSGPIILD